MGKRLKEPLLKKIKNEYMELSLLVFYVMGNREWERRENGRKSHEFLYGFSLRKKKWRVRENEEWGRKFHMVMWSFLFFFFP